MTNSSGSKLNSIQTRILGLFLLIIIVILSITLFVVKDGTYEHSVRQVLIHSDTSARTTSEKIINQSKLLQTALSDVVGNFSVKQLIAGAKEDPDSLYTAMQNFQRRFDADIFKVFDGDNQLLSQSTSQRLDILPQTIFEQKVAFTNIDGQSYLLSAAPMKFVKSSLNIDGWIVMGVKTERLINQSLLESTQIHISLIDAMTPTSVLGSTFSEDLQQQLLNASLNPDGQLHEISLASSLFFYEMKPVVPDSPYYLLLATPSDQAFISYNTLLKDIFVVMVVAAVLALLAAALLSRVIAGPIHTLVIAASKIRSGEYSAHFPDKSTNEVNSLSDAIRDMQTGIQQRENQINELAFYDRLTGLPNRNQFNQKLEARIKACGQKPVMIALIDIDRFKEINDTVGHETGDTLLALITERFRETANSEDFYARIGGDEFAIIFDRPDINKANFIGQQITDVFERPFQIENLVLDVDVSVGIAYAPEHANDAQKLFQCADIALYSCKGTHNAFCVYEESLNKYSLQRLNLMSELKEALAAGELELHYQPKITIVTNNVDTVECLIRWIHPVHGFVPPDQFIELAEQTGAIREVTQWVLKEAISQAHTWREKGITMGVAVNISAVDLADLRLPGYVGRLLAQYNVDASQLTLEITESAIMDNPESAIAALNTLRQMGIYLSIDDFGTGFSSMAQLKKMPVHELKIDKAFVLDLASNKDDQVMVNTLVSLAVNLGLTTVAEGIEDQASFEYLKAIGCTKGQGFHMSRPLPIAKFDPWFEHYIVNNHTE